MTPSYDEQRHPLSRRILHWVMALSILIMIGSGWRIYNASPIFDFLTFPEWATLGGDVEASLARHGDPGVATAIAWHFAAMWTLVIAYVLFLLWGIVTGHFRRDFLPVGPRTDRARHDCGAELSARASAGRIQRSAEGRLLGSARRGRGDDPVRHRDLEASADLSAGAVVRGFPGRARGALPRDGRHRVLPADPCRPYPVVPRTLLAMVVGRATELRHADTSEKLR